MKKGNIRSIRFSDELIEIIEQQQGDNFTQKFERLVYNCYMLLPEKERQLDVLEARYQDTKQRYISMSKRYREAEELLISLEQRLSNLGRFFDECEERLGDRL